MPINMGAGICLLPLSKENHDGYPDCHDDDDDCIKLACCLYPLDWSIEMNGVVFTIANNENWCLNRGLAQANGDTQVLLFEMILPSDHLMLLFGLLKLDYSEYVGEMWGMRLANALASVDIDDIECDGLTREQAEYYLLKLISYASEAITREEMIVWE